MTHSLDNREVYFPIEARGEEKLGETRIRGELTRSKAFPWVPSGKNLFDRKETVPFQCKHVQLLAYAFSRPFRAYRNGEGNRPILGINVDRFLFFFLSFPTKHAPVIAILNERIRFSFLSFFSSILWFRRLSRGIFFSREEKMPRDVIRRRAKGTNFFLSLVDIYSCKMGSIRAISI